MKKILLYLFDYSFAKLLPAVINLAVIYVFSNYYDTQKYGVYLLSFTIVSVVNSILFYWPRLAYLNNSRDVENLAYTNTVAIYCFLAIVYALAFFVFSIFYNLSFYRYITIVFACMSQAYFEFKTEIIRSFLKSKQYAILFVSRSAVFFIATLCLIKLDSTISPDLIIILLGCSYLLLGFFSGTNEKFVFELLNKKEIRKLLVFGLPLFVSYFMEGIISSVDRFILAKYFSVTIVAYYTSTLLIFKQGLGLVGLVIYLAIYPLILKQNRNQGFKIYTLVFIVCTGMSFAVAALSSDFLLQKFFSASFYQGIKDNIYLFLWYTVIYIYKTYYFDIYVQYINKSYFLIFSSAVMAICNLPLNLILIPKYSYSGALYSAMISYSTAVIFLLIAMFFIKHSKEK